MLAVEQSLAWPTAWGGQRHLAAARNSVKDAEECPAACQSAVKVTLTAVALPKMTLDRARSNCVHRDATSLNVKVLDLQ